MNPHNRPIYHCQCCGTVTRQEPFRVPPFCCGQEMTLAGEETLQDDFTKELDADSMLSDPPFAPRWSGQQTGHCSVPS